jgi:hypothetical protein
MAIVKTECPVSLETFMKEAKPIEINMGGQTVIAQPKKFDTGSFGWYFNKKVDQKIADEDCVVQMQILCTVVGSKTAPRTEKETSE